ncbi:Rpn family recombination-promoting nuclease/putative transposase [Parabacteroides faecis]|nr:Rpn family recombination-promoting nuclease/putative transposase [Parabacteroides faecis]MCS2891767.1 Rpn family recombination-promoting nuclease/putative transposase [Parabacteroides faecis]UVQ44618.1 Rpn family recombination-promoting nuclease/putative transposase [Parabacteroides faecis]
MEKYVNIMLDRAFKTVFGEKQVAIDFINATLEGEHRVKDLTYLDKEIQPEVIEQRTVIFDLLCEDVDGSKFILEMQNCPQRYFFNRGFYYICRMVSRQGETGDDWKYSLLPVYGIYLLNFCLPEFQSWRTDVVLANEATGKTFGEVKLKQIYLSFDLFNLSEEECKTPLENMVYILKNMNLFDMSPFKEKNDAFKRLLDVANLEAMTAHERAVYDENLKIYRDWRNTLEYAVEEAEEKGLKKGIEKGLEKGVREGKAEEQRLIAANFKKQGVDIETIARCTGLSVKEINEL